MPDVWHALEFVSASVGERDARADHQILDGPRHEDFPGACAPYDTRSDVDGETGDLVAVQFDLTGVNTGPDLDAQTLDTVTNRTPAQDTARAGPSNRARNPSPSVLTS